MTLFLQAIVSGIVIGSIYAVMTVGLTLVYGALRTLNMAQGSFMMVSGYVAWLISASLGMPLWLAILAGVLVAGLFGVITEEISVRPLVGRKGIDFEMTAYISTLTITIILANAAIMIFGARSKPLPPVISGGLKLPYDVTVTLQSIVIFIVAVGTLVVLGWFLARTRYGLSISAVAQEFDAARLMGVNSVAVYALTMGLAGLLAGIAGVLIAPVYFVSPVSGDLPLLKGLTVAIFGGLGSVRGTIYAAFLVGLIESVATAYVGSGWSLSVLFAMVFVIMILRPNGLFGLPQEERL